MKFLPEPYIDISLKTSHICCLFCIEFCQIICDPCEIRFMRLRSTSRTLHIYLCRLLYWKLRKNMPFIHTKIPYHFDMTLHIAKRIWAMRKKKKKISVPRSMGRRERKKKKKDSPYLKIKIESCRKGCEFYPEKFHTHAHLDLIVWLVFSIGSGFWLYNICETYMLLFIPCPEFHQKSLIRNREERGDPVSWWGIIHIEGSERVIWWASFILILKVIQRPKLFSRKNMVDLILHVGFKKLW